MDKHSFGLQAMDGCFVIRVFFTAFGAGVVVIIFSFYSIATGAD